MTTDKLRATFDAFLESRNTGHFSIAGFVFVAGMVFNAAGAPGLQEPLSTFTVAIAAASFGAATKTIDGFFGKARGKPSA